MKTIITSGPPLRRILCSFLFGAAAFCVVPTNIQAAGDIVWVTANGISKYDLANGTAITNFITEPTTLGGILVSGHILYVATESWANSSFTYALLKGLAYYVIATYDAKTGNVNNFDFFANRAGSPVAQAGMALSGTNLYVANYQVGTIAKINTTTGGGNAFFIPFIVNRGPEHPYALAVNGNVLYVTNNYQNSNGDFYISTYTADTGALINSNFIQIPTGGLYGLALKNNVFGVNSALYVSVYSGNAPGVYIYDATTGQLIKGPFVSVHEPYGIAIGGNTLNTLYVASYQDSAIYEFDATTGAQLSGSIKLSVAPTNITVEYEQ